MAPSNVIVVYYSETPNHPVTKARSCHYHVSTQNMISCGIPYHKYWQRLQQVLKVGKKLAGFILTLQCEMIVKIRYVMKLVMNPDKARPFAPSSFSSTHW